jgi:hypothetical protein
MEQMTIGIIGFGTYREGAEGDGRGLGAVRPRETPL